VSEAELVLTAGCNRSPSKYGVQISWLARPSSWLVQQRHRITDTARVVISFVAALTEAAATLVWTVEWPT